VQVVLAGHNGHGHKKTAVEIPTVDPEQIDLVL
jgi:hypothetical protein